MWSILPLSLLALIPAAPVWSVPVCSTSEAVATTWYTGWHAQYLPLEDVSWEKYSAVSYAFALTTSDSSVITLQDTDQQLLPRFVQTAHQHDVAAILTVGGWTGSQYFSTSVGSASNRTAFVKAVMRLVEEFDLDGIDFDWEYPNKQGMGCNIISPQDTPNFLAFLQELRASEGGQNITLSAASAIVPFAGTDGNPSQDVSAFSKVLDYIAIMDYDVWGTWSSAVGPNAPLDDTCAPPADQQGSAVSAVQAWTKAGFPADQLLLGVASYGHSYHVAQDVAYATAPPSTLGLFSASSTTQPPGTTLIAAYPPFDKSQQPLGDAWDAVEGPGVDQCGNPTSGGASGIFNFRGLVDRGFLNEDGEPVAGMGFRYDNCSQTPFVYDPKTETMISYDDPQSFAAKGQFIQDMGLLGFAMWEAAGDYNDLLLDAISDGIGIGEPCSS